MALWVMITLFQLSMLFSLGYDSVKLDQVYTICVSNIDSLVSIKSIRCTFVTVYKAELTRCVKNTISPGYGQQP